MVGEVVVVELIAVVMVAVDVGGSRCWWKCLWWLPREEQVMLEVVVVEMNVKVVEGVMNSVVEAESIVLEVAVVLLMEVMVKVFFLKRWRWKR